MAHKVTVSPYFYLFLPAAFLLLPLRWIFAWSLAVAVHELGHYLALRLCRVPVQGMEITPFGVRMHTGSLTDREAMVCSFSGPLFGFLLTAFSRFLPYTALCAFLQALFNLLPIYPLDGGRVLFLAWEGITRKPVPQKYEAIVHAVGLVLLLLLIVVVTFSDIIKLF